MARRGETKVVWSSTDGDLRKARPPGARERQAAGGGRVKVRRETGGRRGKTVTTVRDVPLADDALRELAGRVKVRRETSGRRGKAVTTVAGVPLDDAGLKELAGRLKKRCGVGGAVKDGVIELQGDHRDVVLEVLKADGYDAVRAGG
jgi:translation initiation factor 1